MIEPISTPAKERLGREAVFAVIGNFSSTFALAVVIVSIARLSDQTSVGRFSYALALCAPLFLLASLRLRDISATEGKQYSIRAFFLLSALANFLALVAILPVGFLLSVDRETLVTAIFIGLWKSTTAFCDVVYGHHQRETRMTHIARLQLVHSVATVVSFTSILWATGNLFIAVAILGPLHLLIFFCVDLGTISSWGESIVPSEQPSELDLRKYACRLAFMTLPLGVGAAVFSLNMLIPRMLLDRYFSLEQVGVFAALALCARLGTPVMQAIGQTSSAGLARSIRQHDAKQFAAFAVRAVSFPMLIGLVLTILGGLFGPALLQWVYGDTYKVSAWSVILIMVYAALVYASTLLTYSLIAARWLKSHLGVLAVTVLTGWFFGVWLIPERGLWGACVSLVVSSLVRFAGTLIVIALITARLGRQEDHMLNHPRNFPWKATCKS